jgi:hypothetical protein
MTGVLPLVVAAMLQATAATGGKPADMKADGKTAMQTGMTTIEKGADSAVDDARQVTARTQAEWAKVWRAHAFERAAPKVDFTRDMVVGVFMGSRPTAGFDVAIVGTREDKGVLMVQYRETKPGRDKMTAQILTSPYHLVTIPRFNGDVKFEAIP